jgi:uncharacterized protein (DUF2252 family)
MAEQTTPAPPPPTEVPVSVADPSPPRAVARRIDGTTADDRRQFGRSVRAEVPRGVHGAWTPAPDRPDPVALLEEQAEGREPELVPIRYGRMLTSPFAFYRGAALVMAADLARAPSTGLPVVACGDAHLSNFGVFATPERRLAFDVNDFDEAHRAPFEWDVKRLATSLVLVAREQGFGDDVGRRMANAVASEYRTRMLELAPMGFLDAWYVHIDVTSLLEQVRLSGSGKERRRAKAFFERASTRTNLGALQRLAEPTSDGWRIKEEPPLVVRPQLDEAHLEVLRHAMAGYRASLRRDLRPILEHYAFADIARKVVGVGSVGLQSFIVLGIGTAKDDALFLQLKEARASVLEAYTEPSRIEHQGERVVMGQRFMQGASDQLLGWMRVEGLDRPRDFYVRQLRDWKMSFDLAAADEEGLTRYGRSCAQALARAHARSGSSLAIAGYLGRSGSFDEAVERFSVAYADQTELDFAALRDAAASGRITASDVE